MRRLGMLILLTTLLAACGGGPPAAPAATSAPAAASAPAASVTEAPTSAPAPAASGGTLRIGRTAGPDSLNPGAGYLAEAFDIYDLVYDSLIYVNQKSQVEPLLATKFEPSADGTTWSFTIREGVKWHDGQPLTAEDVAFTYSMISGFEGFGFISSYTTRITDVQAPSPTTVTITFDGPVVNTDERFGSVYILPKHIWEQFADEKAAVEFENLEMIGSGPFKMAEYKQGEFTRLVANKEHFLSPPNIDEAIFRVYGSADALIQALKVGEVDFVTDPAATAIRTLQADPIIEVAIGRSRRLTDIVFNVTEPANCPPEVGKCTGHPALRDVRVRQALAHATEKQQLIDTVLLGLGEPGLSLVTPSQGAAYHALLQDYAFDLAKANAILDEAGYTDSDGDEVREMPGDPSMPLSFRYSYPSDQNADTGPRFFEVLRDSWKQAGVVITLTPLDADALTAACCPAFDFDVMNWGWYAGVDPGSLLNIVTTDEIGSGTSESGYSNPEYDKLFLDQGVTTDKEARIAIIKQMQEILMRDLPYIVPFYRQGTEAYRTDRFTGWNLDPDAILYLANREQMTKIVAIGP